MPPSKNQNPPVTVSLADLRRYLQSHKEWSDAAIDQSAKNGTLTDDLKWQNGYQVALKSIAKYCNITLVDK